MGNQSNIEALKAMGYEEPEYNIADLYDTPDNHESKAKNLPIFSVAGMFFNRLAHVGKKYYYGRMARWLLKDKNGNGVYCDKCGNIANGIEEGCVLGLTYRIPLCKNHLGY